METGNKPRRFEMEAEVVDVVRLVISAPLSSLCSVALYGRFGVNASWSVSVSPTDLSLAVWLG